VISSLKKGRNPVPNDGFLSFFVSLTQTDFIEICLLSGPKIPQNLVKLASAALDFSQHCVNPCFRLIPAVPVHPRIPGRTDHQAGVGILQLIVHPAPAGMMGPAADDSLS